MTSKKRNQILLQLSNELDKSLDNKALSKKSISITKQRIEALDSVLLDIILEDRK